MKQPSERGVVGAWAFAARRERGLSVEQVAEAVGAKGQAVSPATIRGIESGLKRPAPRLLRLLGEVLESEPPGVTSLAAPDPVSTALDRQTAVLDRIATVLEGIMTGGALPPILETAAKLDAFVAERTSSAPTPPQRTERSRAGTAEPSGDQ